MHHKVAQRLIQVERVEVPTIIAHVPEIKEAAAMAVLNRHLGPVRNKKPRKKKLIGKLVKPQTQITKREVKITNPKTIGISLNVSPRTIPV